MISHLRNPQQKFVWELAIGSRLETLWEAFCEIEIMVKGGFNIPQQKFVSIIGIGFTIGICLVSSTLSVICLLCIACIGE